MTSKLWLLPLIVALAASSARPDSIGLKNGDRLTGKVVRCDGKTLHMKTELAGDVTVPWDAVVEVSSDTPVFVTFADGRTVSGALSSSSGRIEVRPAEGDAVVAETASIASIRNADEQKEFERMVSPGWFSLWQGGASFGVALTQGNSDTTTITSGVALARRTSRDKTSVYLASLYSRDGNAPEESRTTANIIRGGVRYDYDLSSRSFVYAFADLEHNEPQDLTLRFVPGGGFGYHVIKSERTHFDIFGGANFNREWFDIAPDRSSGEAQVGQSLNVQCGSRTSLAEQFVFFPNLTDPGEYRINFDAGVTTAVTKRIGWQVTVSNRFLSSPSPGFERNDLILTTGLTFKIGR